MSPASSRRQAIGNGPTAALTNSKAVRKAPARLAAIWRGSVAMNILILPFGPDMGLDLLLQGACQLDFFVMIQWAGQKVMVPQSHLLGKIPNSPST
jgi:hypothetical protein